MKRIINRPLQLLALILFFTSAAFAQIQIPQHTGYVNDFANKLSQPTKQSLENLLTNFASKTQIEVAVVTLPFDQMGGYAIEEYALEMARKWGLGKDANQPSALLLVAIKEKGADGIYHGGTRLEISRHLEGDIPDGLAGELIRRMRKDFNAGNFDSALPIGVQTILATIAEKRGLSMEGIDASAAYHPPRRSPSRGISPSTIIFFIIIIFAIISFFSRIGRGGGGGGGGRRGKDWWIAPMIWGGGGTGWGGGGGSSEGGSSWGGFGGGGDFGGGGASDSW
ncbi:MAG: TPM domain-containing protein [Acidobacteria bacterium]|nr:TPM domain-containing protein [Acidobacteriota bacterium]